MKRNPSLLLCGMFMVCLCAHLPLQAQSQDSSRIRISLLTCTPGEDLYSIFGHSALRVIDSNSVTDIVYNYGTFDFYEPGFYIKFIRGKLLYSLSIENFQDFKVEYQLSNRGITEQLLNFSGAEKLQIRHALNDNLKEENRYYKYDFFLDNCTTRLRDLLIQNRYPTPESPPVMPGNTSFRQAIHLYLDKGKQYWSKLGIDILLGARTDHTMTSAQQEFLPDNLMKALDQSRPSIVTRSAELYGVTNSVDNASWFTPMIFFSSLLLLFLLLSLLKNSAGHILLAGLDGSLFFITGLLGILLIFMWFGTDHSMTKNNYNLLWALPTHSIAAFWIKSKKPAIKYYFLFTAITLTALLMAWAFLPERLNPALIPLVLSLIYRSVVRFQK